MRIMTWNIHGASLRDRDERFPLIKKAIEDTQPDIACIQEAFFPKSRKMLESINGYYVSYQTNWYPIPGMIKSTAGGLVTLTKGKPTEVNYYPYLTQGTWVTEQRWDRLIGKGFLETIIEDKEFGRVTIINTHKVCTYTDDTDKYLESQADQLLQRIHQQKEKGELIILAGDMNFQRQSKLYPQFKEILHDATEGLHEFIEEVQKLHLFKYKTIDYIFTGDKYHCEPMRLYHKSWKKYPSDHPYIIVNLKRDH